MSAIFAQGPITPPGLQKWNTDGNSATNTDFIGTINYTPLIFKTNNVKAFEIDPNGDIFLSKLSGPDEGLIKHDHDGKIRPIPFNNSFSQVLSSSGVWQEISTFTGLEVISNNIIQVASGNFGIGTSAPTAKLTVNGTGSFSGELLAQQGIKFDNINGILYNNVAGMKTFSYGKAGATLRTTCAALASPYPIPSAAHLFSGTIQIYDADATGNIKLGSGLLNLQTWAPDPLIPGSQGGSSIDASIEGGTATGRLLLNYFCGNSTFINTGTYGGDVIMTTNTLGKVGIGISPTEKLDVAGNIALNNNDLLLRNHHHGLGWYGNDPAGNKPFTTTAGENIDGPVLYGWDGGALGSNYYSTPGSDIKKIALRWTQDGKVGIGTTVPTSINDKLCVAAVGYSSNSNGGISIQSADGYAEPMWQARLALKSDETGNARTAFDFITRYSAFTSVEVMSFLPNGNVGIGTTNPIAPLEVAGTATFRGQNITLGNPTGSPQENVNLTYVSTDPAYSRALLMGKLNVGLSLGTNNQEQLSIDVLGNVGIGTGIDHIPADCKLAVNGNMRAKDIVVTLTGWPDFVFEDNYKRMNILEKEAFYKKEKHLPNIKPAKEIETDGLQIGKSMNGIVQNIEENTLDIADLYKRIVSLEKENSELKESLKNLNAK